MGVAATQMERKGIRTERGDQNRQIEVTNKQIRQLRARINKLADWLNKEAANPTPPTLADVLDEIFTRPGQSALTHVKNGAEILLFLQQNNIRDFEDLDNSVDAMHGKLNAASKKLNDVERRIKTLNEHFVQSGYYKEHRSLKRQYDKLYSAYTAAKKETGFFAERKAHKALDAANDFYEANRTGLALFDAAEKYLREHMQKHFDPKKLPPIFKWEKELAEKLEVKDSLYREYHKLKDDTAKVEKIQRSVKNILHSEMEVPERTLRNTQGIVM